jgi:predicted ester cyclase
MSEQDARIMGKRFFQSQDMTKGGPARDLVTDSYQLTIAGNPLMDWQGHDQFGRMFYEGFPDLHHTFGEPVQEGNRIVQPFILNGTHTGEFMGIPATGKIIRVEAIGIFELVDGKVDKLYGVFDQLGMMRQLGVIA